MGFCIINLAQFPGFTGSFQELRIRSITVLITDGKKFSGCMRRIYHSLGICVAGSHRLFTHYMLPSLHSRDGNGGVRIIGCQNINRVQFFTQQFLIIRIYSGILCTKFSLCRFRPLLNQIAKRHDLEVAILFDRDQMLAGCNTTAADNSYC